jgi:hypothetical protein
VKATNEIKDKIAQIKAKEFSLNDLLFCANSWDD